MSDTATHSIDAAQRVQEKFQFYILALTFTLLGLSVETAEFGVYLGSDVSELLSWLLLVASGIVGVLRTEWIPVLFVLDHLRRFAGSEVIHMTNAAATGVREVEYAQGKQGENVLPVDVAIKARQQQIESVNNQFDALTPKVERAYSWQRWLLVAGIVGLMISRGWVGVAAILSHF